MPAGYSGTPLTKKLGIKPGHRIALLRAPADFDYEDLPPGVDVKSSLRGTKLFDVIHFFTDSRAELERTFPRLKARLIQNGGLWISWPKKASGLPTDLTGNIVRAIGLNGGLVDNRVCAVTESLSGLRFVFRLIDRTP